MRGALMADISDSGDDPSGLLSSLHGSILLRSDVMDLIKVAFPNF